MTIRRVVTSKSNYDIETYVGRPDEIFYGPDGILRYGDGESVGGTPFGNVRDQDNFVGSGSFNLRISEIDANNQPLVTVENVKSIKFDKETGFNVEDLGNGEVKISLGSTFKTWKVDGQEDLVAVGEDIIKFEAGAGIKITTDPNAAIKTIKIEQTGELSDFLLEPATETTKGGVIVGDNLSVESNGLIRVKSKEVVEEVVKAPILVEIPEENQALMYKNGKWTNSPSMFWSSRNW